MRTQSILVALLFVATALFPMSLFIGTRDAGALPPPIGDWIITSAESYDGGTVPIIIVNGNLTIEDGGNLTLTNGVDLRIASTTPGEFHIRVKDGGALHVDASRIEAHILPNRMHFYVEEGATVSITGLSTVRDIGYLGNDFRDAGLSIESDDVVIKDSDFVNNPVGLIIMDSSPRIINNVLAGMFSAGMIVYGDSAAPVIGDNEIYNTYGDLGFGPGGGMLMFDGAGGKIFNNDIHDNVMGIFIYAASPTIDGNMLNDNFNLTTLEGAGIAISEGSRSKITNNTIANSGNGIGIAAGAGTKPYIADNHASNSFAGIMLQLFADATVVDNDINNNYLGIAVTEQGKANISRNNLEDNLVGIQIQQGSPLVTKNTIRGVDAPLNTRTGILISDFATPIIRGNSILNLEGEQSGPFIIGGDGYSVERYAMPVIDGNKVTGCANFALTLDNFGKAKVANETYDNNFAGISIGYYAELDMRDSTVAATDFYGIEGAGGKATFFNVDVDNPPGSATANGIYFGRGEYTFYESLINGTVFDVVVGPEADIKLISSSHDADNVTFTYSLPMPEEDLGHLRVGHYTNVSVEWENNNAPIVGADVSILPSEPNGTKVITTTDENGMVMAEVFEYRRSYLDLYENYTPYEVNVSINGLEDISDHLIKENTDILISIPDPTYPNLTIDAPAEGEHTNVSTIDINGTAWDDESGLMAINYTIDEGQNWTSLDYTIVNGTAFWDKTLELEDGAYNLTVAAINGAGMMTTGTVNFTVDTVMRIKVLNPQEGMYVNTENITVNGTGEDGLMLTVNGVNVTVVNGTWEMDITLANEGLNNITVMAEDLAGNSYNETFMVYLDTVVPEIIITEPTVRYLNSEDVTISGTVSEDAEVLVKGNPVVLDGLVFSITFMNLSAGLHNYTITAEDMAGNLGEALVSFTIDRRPPALNITAPGDGHVTNMGNITVNGTTTGVRVIIERTAVPVVNGTFEANVTLVEGVNGIRVQAFDEAGNVAEETVSVTRDLVAPPLTVSSPKEMMRTNEVIIDIEGTTEMGADIYINGMFEMIADDGVFSATYLLVNVSEGPYDINVTAMDAAGNSVTEARTIIYDWTPPLVTIEHFKNETVYEKEYTIEGTVEPGGSVFVNDVEIPVADDGSFAYDVRLRAGMNELVVTAYDEAGNMNVLVANINYEEPFDYTIWLIAFGMILMGAFLGIGGGYAWGRHVSTKERPPRFKPKPPEEMKPAPRPEPKKEPLEGPKEELNVSPPPVEKEVVQSRPAPKPEAKPAPAPKPEPPVDEKDMEDEVTFDEEPAPKPEPKKEVPVKKQEPAPSPKPEPRKGPAKPEPKKGPAKPEPKKEEVDDDLAEILSRLGE